MRAAVARAPAPEVRRRSGVEVSEGRPKGGVRLGGAPVASLGAAASDGSAYLANLVGGEGGGGEGGGGKDRRRGERCQLLE